MRNLKGKVAFVTGGASGIGLGIVQALLDQGVKVMVADLRQDHLDEVKTLLKAYDGVHFFQLDVSDRAQMAAAAAHTVTTFGKVHILVNNAGVGVCPTVDAMTYEDWDWVLGVNLGGPINGIMSFLPHILAHGEGGHIVSTASMAGLLPTCDNFIYAASKYGVRGLSDSLRLTLAPRKVGVSVLYPGLTRSRMLQSEENRPARYTVASPVAPPPGPAIPPGDAGMDPREAGEAVVRGIRENAGYILSHSEFRDELAEHFASILAASPPPQNIDPGRLFLENARRAQTAAAMAAVDALTQAEE